uniref:Ig-like domain-containing protein n=1 Tax=Esox lucius TaxID=8010 RepID=A0AAY5KUE7_ESOLU
MKTILASASLCFGILFMCVSFSTTGSSQIQVVGQTGPVVAKEGDDIILPCSLVPKGSVEDTIVEWTRSDLNTNKKVHLYKDGKDTVGDQIPGYMTRTSLFKEEMKTGNISLKLSGVKLSDTGNYTCRLPKENSQGTETTIRLIVDATTFLNIFRNDLIWNVTKVMPIVNGLLETGLIQKKVKSMISTAGTHQDQMRQLFQALDEGDVEMKSAFYSLLCKHEPDLTGKLDAVDFVNSTRDDLIQKVTNVTLIADRLLQKGLILEEVYSGISTAESSQDQMILLFHALDEGGSEVKSAFYRILLEHQPVLVQDLGGLLRNNRKLEQKIKDLQGGVFPWSRWEVAVLIICLLALLAVG